MLVWALELKSHGVKPGCIKRISETENEGDKRVTSILNLKIIVSISSYLGYVFLNLVNKPIGRKVEDSARKD